MSDLNKLDQYLAPRLKTLEDEVAQLRQSIGSIASFGALKEVDVYTFPHGAKPVRQTEGAIGFDAYARAVVDPTSKPTEDNPLRETLADFHKTEDWRYRLHESLHEWVLEDAADERKYQIALPPGKRLMVGLGFATKMNYPMFYWVAPRSGYAARGITVANSPGTVDPDYRGEAGALIENNSNEDFVISHNMRLVQVIFSLALVPSLNSVDNHSELGSTTRGRAVLGLRVLMMSIDVN
jgi:dUTP pyrophosphatase